MSCGVISSIFECVICCFVGSQKICNSVVIKPIISSPALFSFGISSCWWKYIDASYLWRGPIFNTWHFRIWHYLSLLLMSFCSLLMHLNLYTVFWFTVAGCMVVIIMPLSDRLFLISGMHHLSRCLVHMLCYWICACTFFLHWITKQDQDLSTRHTSMLTDVGLVWKCVILEGSHVEIGFKDLRFDYGFKLLSLDVEKKNCGIIKWIWTEMFEVIRSTANCIWVWVIIRREQRLRTGGI